MCWCRSRSIRPIPIACRAAWSSSPATSFACRSGRARWLRSYGQKTQNPIRACTTASRMSARSSTCRRLKEELRSLVDWVSNYTLSARGMVLRMSLRMGENLGPERSRVGVRLIGEPPRRMTPARRRVIECLSDGLLHGKSDAAREAGVSTGVIDGLVDEGTLETEAMPPPPPPPAPDPVVRAAGIFAASSAPRSMRCGRWRRTAVFTPRCSMASPAPARPKFISRRSPRRSGAASNR